MRSKYLIYSLLFLFISIQSALAQKSNAQELDDLLNGYYKKGYNDIKSYLITDKDIYEIGETIWLTALVVDRRSHKKFEGKNTLKVVLYDNKGESNLTTKLFCAEGLAKGSLVIPDGFVSGRYMLSITAGNEKLSSFQKEIMIKKSAVPIFIADISFDHKYYGKGDMIMASIKLKGYHNEPIKSGNLSVELRNGDIIHTSEKLKLGKNGVTQASVKIPNNISSGLTFHLEIKKKGIVAYFDILVPMNTDNVFFYCVPEGRSLVEGVPTKIYFRTNDSYGNAFPFLGQISDGSGKVISEVSGDDNGKGEFMYTPRANDKLSLLIARPFNGQLEVNLPKVQTQGASLVAMNDSESDLELEIKKGSNTSFQFNLAVIHRGQRIYFNELGLKEDATHSISKSALKIGVNQITLFDSNMKPLSEQLYFLPDNQTETTVLTQDKNELDLRGRNDVTITSSNKLVLSLRALDQSRLFGLMPKQNMVSFLYYDSEILDPVVLENMNEIAEVNKQLKFCSSVNVWTKIREQAGLSGVQNNFAKGWTTNFEKTPLIRSVANGRVHYSNYTYSEYYLALNPELQDEVIAKSKANSSGGMYLELLKSGSTVRAALNSIKPYNVNNEGIFFYGSPNSINGQEGAIIIIDGINRGTKIGALDAIEPFSIASMKASADPMDINRYTSQNSTGIVIIKLKDGTSGGKTAEAETDFQAPEYPDKSSRLAKKKDLRTTIQWKPFQLVKESFSKITMYHSDVQARVLGIAEGIDTDGNPFHKTFEYATY
jgi:hypothetical protein